MSHPSRASRRSRWILALGLVLTVGTWSIAVLRFVPDSSGNVGNDYAYFFPRLLAGAYWFKTNGLAALPWFTPAFGGGIPFYANPASCYVSLPQALTIAAGPIVAVQVTAVSFAAVGFLGTWLLVRRVFSASAWAALFAAVAFTWCDFHSVRLIVGHLGFHSQTLVPLGAYFLLRPPPAEGARIRRMAVDACLAGLIFSYFLQSGNMHGLVPAAIASTALASVLALRGEPLLPFFVRLAAAMGLAALLCLAKLMAALAFLAAFPRTGYPLPGFRGLWSAGVALVRCLFFAPPENGAAAGLMNTEFEVGKHEFEFGLSWVPLLLFAAALFTRRSWTVEWRRRKAVLALLAAVLLIPWAVNLYGAGWTAFLERVPILGSSSILLRWFVAYVPLVAVAGALAIDRVAPSERARMRIGLAAAVALVGLQWASPRDYLVRDGYPIKLIEAAAARLRHEGFVPPITKSDIIRDQEGRPAIPIGRDDTLLNGTSQILCYEPMFGYFNEWMPIDPLQPGNALELSDGVFNFKNPAGYLFPGENGLVAGGHFRADQRAELEAFLAYRPFPFVKPARQIAAEWINVLAIVATLGFLGWSALRARAERAASAGPAAR